MSELDPSRKLKRQHSKLSTVNHWGNENCFSGMVLTGDLQTFEICNAQMFSLNREFLLVISVKIFARLGQAHDYPAFRSATTRGQISSEWSADKFASNDQFPRAMELCFDSSLSNFRWIPLSHVRAQLLELWDTSHLSGDVSFLLTKDMNPLSSLESWLLP